MQEATDRYGTSLRHWQFPDQCMAISVRTLIQTAKALGVPARKLLKG